MKSKKNQSQPLKQNATALQSKTRSESKSSHIEARPRPSLILSSWQHKVTIQTLGAFVIAVENRPIEFIRKIQRRPLALLKALIAYGGCDVPKTLLADVLWPEADGDQAHQAFATTLHRVRKLIGNEKIVLLRDGKVSLNPQFCNVDVWQFESYVRQQDQNQDGKEKQSLHEQGRMYLSLYTGTFLTDDADEEWAHLIRERLRGRFIRGCCRIADHLGTSGKHEIAYSLLEQAIEREPAATSLYHTLITILRKSNRESEAQSVEDQYQRIVQHSLPNNTPTPSLRLVPNPLQLC